jgi:Fur family ferric uptake transcriptional regulator
MIMNAPSDRLLKTFRLRSTPSRQEILHLFLNKDYALSHGDIEKEINNELDRVTVYRTLKTFLDKGLIHKVLDDEGSLKYALCNDACSTTTYILNALAAAKLIASKLRSPLLNYPRATGPAKSIF